MPKFLWGTICEAATIDQQTNQISLIKIIEETNVIGKLPALYPGLTLFVMWAREDEKDDLSIPVRVRFDSPGHEKVNSNPVMELDLSFSGGEKRARMLITAGNLPITGTGENLFIIEFKKNKKWEQAGTVTLEVTAGRTPQTTYTFPGIDQSNVVNTK